ncbi:MAG: ribonuclease PH [Spirochaetaceae bacterium]|nr:ribonuclease PH [Spirochaetaceae bacterium]
MRPVSFERNFIKTAAGSCLASFGETKVICTCTIENGTPPFVSGGAWLTAEYSMLPGSVSVGRKRRDGVKRDGRSVEIQRLIGRSLRAAVEIAEMPEVTLTIDCDVLQADGGTRTAAISGAWLALYDALKALDADPKGSIPEGWLLGRIAAVSVGIVGGEVVCDLDFQADRAAEVDMNVVTLNDSYVEIQGTGEKGVFDRGQLETLLNSAESGLKIIAAAQDAALGR